MDLSRPQLEAFVERLKNDRSRRNLSRSAYCALVGISRMTLRQLERVPPRQPTQATINKFAKVLKMSPGVLTGESRHDLNVFTKDLRNEDYRLANQFHHAGAEAKHAIKEFFSPERSEESRERLALLLKRLMRQEEESLLKVIEEYLIGIEKQDAKSPSNSVEEDKSRAGRV